MPRYGVSKAKAGLWPGAEGVQGQDAIAGERSDQQAKTYLTQRRHDATPEKTLVDEGKKNGHRITKNTQIRGSHG